LRGDLLLGGPRGTPLPLGGKMVGHILLSFSTLIERFLLPLGVARSSSPVEGCLFLVGFNSSPPVSDAPIFPFLFSGWRMVVSGSNFSPFSGAPNPAFGLFPFERPSLRKEEQTPLLSLSGFFFFPLPGYSRWSSFPVLESSATFPFAARRSYHSSSLHRVAGTFPLLLGLRISFSSRKKVKGIFPRLAQSPLIRGRAPFSIVT